MEKYAVRRKTSEHSGLLTKLLSKNARAAAVFATAVAIQNVYCVPPSAQELKTYTVRQQSSLFFTQTESCYSLTIPEIAPSKIQTNLTAVPAGVQFISSKKEEFRDENGKRGTQILLCFSFTEAGTAHIPPLAVQIRGKTWYVPFEDVVVYENPNFISPVMEISFASPKNLRTDSSGKKTYTAQTGEKINFTVGIKYCAQILHFDWKLPGNSIFVETNRYDSIYAEKDSTFTPETKKIADFEWTVLKEGVYELPDIRVEALSYNGARKNSPPPPIDIIIEKSGNFRSTERNYAISDTKLLASAFKEPSVHDAEEHIRILTMEECGKIAARQNNSFLRRLFPQKNAVFAGGFVHPVPEQNSHGQLFSGGQTVKIMETVGEWLFIECAEFSGWTQKEQVFEPQKQRRN